MTTIEINSVEKNGVRIAKKMIESKREMQKELLWAYENDPKVKEAISKLKKRNAERGTPVVTKI
jgi:hypothetical protein